MRLRPIAIAAFVALAACGSTTSSSVQPSPSANAVGKGLFAIATGLPGSQPVNIPGNGPATVKLVDAQGHVHATASFQPPPAPKIGTLPVILQSPVRVAADAAYYSDTTGAIHKLAADGSKSVVATFPLTNAEQELTYAVSPDGAHLMAVILSIPLFPDGGHWMLKVESADVGGSTTITFQSDLGTLRPQPTLVVGWDSKGPLATLNSALGTVSAMLSSHFYGQSGGGAPLIHLASDGTHLDRIGGPNCLAVDEIADGTVACGDFNTPQFIVRSSTGAALWQASLPPDGFYGGPWLSPDGRTIAAQGFLVTQGAVASVPGQKAGEMLALGWLDSTTVVEATPSGQLSLYNTKGFKKIRDLGVSGIFEGVLTSA